MDKELDKLIEKIAKVKIELKEYIAEIRKKFASTKITYAHNHKYVSKDSVLSIYIEILIGCTS